MIIVFVSIPKGMTGFFLRKLDISAFTKSPDNVLRLCLPCLNNSSRMGRPKDFPKIYDDLLTKYKSKSTADKEYKEYLAMARVRVSW